jgi:hypothetical protein
METTATLDDTDESHTLDDDFDNERVWMATGWMRRGEPAAFQPPATTGDAAPITEPRFLLDWVDLHRQATQPADPTYPTGTAIDVALDAMRACRLELPCPAERCGLWVITCRACGFSIALATAGRADDPKSVRVPCKLH